MKTIFDSCQPRDEVLKGELKDEIFRASLNDVHLGEAEDVYQDPKIFFDHTYRTDGLKTLLNEALGRLTGVKPANSPVIRLETSFGGGKTHNLIALYHLASGKVSADLVSDLLTPELVPSKPIRIVPLSGSDLDPSGGMIHGPITTYTLWEEMAFQVDGADSYKKMEKNDRERGRPGEPRIKELLGTLENSKKLIQDLTYEGQIEVLKIIRKGMVQIWENIELTDWQKEYEQKEEEIDGIKGVRKFYYLNDLLKETRRDIDDIFPELINSKALTR